MNKEFEKKFVIYPSEDNPEQFDKNERMIFETNPDIVWQWIEQQIKQARIDELSLLLESGSIKPSDSINELIDNRIKELKK